MALRTKAAIGVMLASAVLAMAGELEFQARHDHWHKGGEGTLAFTDEAVRWTESGKKTAHSRTWKYSDIQRLELEPKRVRITTYDDVRLQFGRDRVFTFDRIPDGMAAQLHPYLATRMDQRFVSHFADGEIASLYQTDAKFLHGTRGANGILSIGSDRIVFNAGGAESRDWRYADVTSVSSADPFQLTINTIEGENRFQLKQRLPEDRYQDLWRRISESNGLKIYRSQLETHHEGH
jgi:hypothetical protein